MTPQEQGLLPWLLSPKSDVSVLRSAMRSIEALVRTGTRASVNSCRYGSAVTLTFSVDADRPRAWRDSGGTTVPLIDHIIRMHIHPSLIAGNGPSHPWDADDVDVTDAFVRVLHSVTTADTAEDETVYPPGGPTCIDGIHDARTAIALLRMDDNAMPDRNTWGRMTTLAVATPLGTGGLSVYDNMGPGYATDLSKRYLITGGIDVRTQTITTNNGTRYMESGITAPTIGAQLPEPSVVERLRLERQAVDDEKRWGDRP